MTLPATDLVLLNGKVITMDPAQPSVTAVAIRNGTIVAIGSDAHARSAAAPGARIIDLLGRTATPGLNDAHAHPMLVGFALDDLDLAASKRPTIGVIQDLVHAAGSSRPPGQWIIGRGYDDATVAEGRHPNRNDLDAVAPDHPVLLFRMCHHIAAANSRALEAAGITRDTPNPSDGLIDRNERGEPTGVLREGAIVMVQRAIGDPSIETLAAAIERAGHAFLRSGITSVAEAGIDLPEEFRAYQDLRAAGRLPVRTYLMMMMDENLDAMANLGVRTGFGDDRLRIGPAKLFSDGSIGGRTAKMRRPYEGETDNTGLLMMPPDVLKAKVLRAHRAGFQVAIHAIGDGAIDLVLDAYEAAMASDPRPDSRHRIEHCSIVDEATIARIARLGVIPIPGTSFLYHFRNAYIANLGENRIRFAYGMATFGRHGILAAASSDAPVVPTSATIGLQTMMTRRDVQGRPVWPEEAISLDDALTAYSVNGAHATFEERIKGTLTPGKLGDVTVFESDLRTVDPGDIGAVQVDLTIVGGAVAFEREQQPA